MLKNKNKNIFQSYFRKLLKLLLFVTKFLQIKESLKVSQEIFGILIKNIIINKFVYKNLKYFALINR